MIDRRSNGKDFRADASTGNRDKMSFITGQQNQQDLKATGSDGTVDAEKLKAWASKFGSWSGLQTSDFAAGGKSNKPGAEGTGGFTPDSQGKTIGGAPNTDEPKTVQNVFKPNG